MRAMTFCCQCLTDSIDVLLQVLVFVDTVLIEYLEVEITALPDFLLLGHGDKVAVTGDWIGYAAGCQR